MYNNQKKYTYTTLMSFPYQWNNHQSNTSRFKHRTKYKSSIRQECIVTFNRLLEFCKCTNNQHYVQNIKTFYVYKKYQYHKIAIERTMHHQKNKITKKYTRSHINYKNQKKKKKKRMDNVIHNSKQEVIIFHFQNLEPIFSMTIKEIFIFFPESCNTFSHIFLRQNRTTQLVHPYPNYSIRKNDIYSRFKIQKLEFENHINANSPKKLKQP
eukprot:TRINITY_DN24739_c0_g1_i5.p1 TRINITY_DN24739_c0_g1~~TRINITY_DN24739_c0_g1_i5.p1  ORF type:complete len:211 (+),score=-3.93 TRINITY_DN24739_c0_g1_i5:931-1563(+)